MTRLGAWRPFRFRCLGLIGCGDDEDETCDLMLGERRRRDEAEGGSPEKVSRWGEKEKTPTWNYKESDREESFKV